MKVTIEITEVEAKGLKDYLKDSGQKGTKQDIKIHLQNIVTGVINAPQEASSYFINKHRRGVADKVEIG